MPHVSTSAGVRDPEPARVGAHRLLDAAAVLAQRVPLRELEEQRLGLGARLRQWRWPARGAKSTGTASSSRRRRGARERLRDRAEEGLRDDLVAAVVRVQVVRVERRQAGLLHEVGVDLGDRRALGRGHRPDQVVHALHPGVALRRRRGRRTAGSRAGSSPRSARRRRSSCPGSSSAASRSCSRGRRCGRPARSSRSCRSRMSTYAGRILRQVPGRRERPALLRVPGSPSFTTSALPQKVLQLRLEVAEIAAAARALAVGDAVAEGQVDVRAVAGAERRAAPAPARRRSPGTVTLTAVAVK